MHAYPEPLAASSIHSLHPGLLCRTASGLTVEEEGTSLHPAGQGPTATVTYEGEASTERQPPPKLPLPERGIKETSSQLPESMAQQPRSRSTAPDLVLYEGEVEPSLSSSQPENRCEALKWRQTESFPVDVETKFSCSSPAERIWRERHQAACSHYSGGPGARQAG